VAVADDPYIAALAAKVAALEAQVAAVPVGEENSPNYLTLGANGTITGIAGFDTTLFLKASELYAFDLLGSSSTGVAIPVTFTSIWGVFRCTGFSPGGGGPWLQQVLFNGNLIGQSSFYFNTVNEHTTLIVFANAVFAPQPPGNYIFSLNYPLGITFDANDRFGGIFAIY